MRLSMWILADWLKEFHPETKIEEGQRILRCVRMFSEDLKASRSTVWLKQTEDDRVLCLNGKDMLLLETSDLNLVFNSILDAFDYYNEASAQIYEKIHDRCPISDLLLAGKHLLGRYLILADPAFYVLETEGDLSDFEEKEQIEEVFRNHLLPIDILMRINGDHRVRLQNQETYLIGVPEMQVTTAVTNIFLLDEHKGWLVTIDPKADYSKGALDLQDAFSEIVAEWLRRNESYERKMKKSAVLADFLDGIIAESSRVDRQLEVFGWKAGDEKIIYILRECKSGTTPAFTPDRILESRFSGTFSIHHEGRTAYLINRQISSEYTVEQEMISLLIICGCYAGKSPVFTDFMNMRSALQAAQIAADYGSGEKGRVYLFKDSIFPYARMLLRDACAADLCHPAVELLEEDPTTKHLDLLLTLSVFLKNNCSYTETARELHLHRSSLLYRLDKIHDKTGVDINNSKERFWLELSLFIKGFLY